MANCETCKMKTSAPENVPYIVHESALARMERMVKRLWVTVLVLIFLLVGTNGAWLWYESQFEEYYEGAYDEYGNDFPRRQALIDNICFEACLQFVENL